MRATQCHSRAVLLIQSELLPRAGHQMKMRRLHIWDVRCVAVGFACAVERLLFSSDRYQELTHASATSPVSRWHTGCEAGWTATTHSLRSACLGSPSSWDVPSRPRRLPLNPRAAGERPGPSADPGTLTARQAGAGRQLVSMGQTAATHGELAGPVSPKRGVCSLEVSGLPLSRAAPRCAGPGLLGPNLAPRSVRVSLVQPCDTGW